MTHHVINLLGCVGETTFHVCFLMQTPTHLVLARRLLKWYPKLINDIYMSEEYYGENVLHMSCVAEDPTMVKYLLDQGIGKPHIFLAILTIFIQSKFRVRLWF